MTELTIEDLIANLNDHNASVRSNAAWLLGRMRDMRIVAPLIARIEDEDATVRMRVVEALGTRHEIEIIAPLIARLQDDNLDVIRTAIRSLGYIGNTEAIPPLINLLNHDDASVRTQAIDALGTLKANSAIHQLIQVVIEDKDTTTRQSAMQAIIALDIEATTQPLMDALNAQVDNIPVLLDLIQVVAPAGIDDARPLLEQWKTHADADVQYMAKWGIETLDKKASDSLDMFL